MPHTHCPECQSELEKGLFGTRPCPQNCPPYCQKCGRKEELATGMDYWCPACPTSLKEILAQDDRPKRVEPMAYPGVAVAVIVVCSDREQHHPRGRVLAGKRKGELGTGLWSLPGGKVDFGETPWNAAIREVKEETNLDLDTLSMHFTGIVTNDFFPEQGKHFVCLYYMASIMEPDDMKIMEPDKIEDWKWFDPHGLPPMWNDTRNLINSIYGFAYFENPDVGEAI